MKELLPIGDFAARSGLSARVLRGYAAAGLLVPAAVDGRSGYRYYAPGQLELARLILQLRRARVPLAEIALFVRNPDSSTLRRWESELDLEARNRRQALTEACRHLSLAAHWGQARHEGDDDMTAPAIGSATDQGTTRTANQDALLVSPPLFAVADGLGQSPGGETASRLALDTLSAAFTGPPSAEALAVAFRQASRAVWEKASTDPSLRGMGTTLTAIALLQTGHQTRLAVASIGDSRAYLFQDGQLRQLTRDHSVTQALIDAGQITAAHWRTHPDRSLLTRALGIEPVVEPDINLPGVTGNARLLLCTDGLTAQAEQAEITAILSGPGDAGQAASELIDLANSNGGTDNTAVIIDLTNSDPACSDRPCVLSGLGSRSRRAAVPGGWGRLGCWDAGVRARGRRADHFLGWVGDHDTGRATMQHIKGALGIGLRVVRLSVPVAEIERRLTADVTSARKDDLRDAAEAVAASAGAGLEDLLIDGTGPVQDIARQIMSWLSWH